MNILITFYVFESLLKVFRKVLCHDIDVSASWIVEHGIGPYFADIVSELEHVLVMSAFFEITFDCGEIHWFFYDVEVVGYV